MGKPGKRLLRVAGSAVDFDRPVFGDFDGVSRRLLVIALIIAMAVDLLNTVRGVLLMAAVTSIEREYTNEATVNADLRLGVIWLSALTLVTVVYYVMGLIVLNSPATKDWYSPPARPGEPSPA